MKKAAVLILIVLVALGIWVVQKGGSENVRISTTWHDNLIPFYTPEIEVGEQKTLWFRVQNRLEKPRSFRADIQAGKYVSVVPREKELGTVPAKSESGLQKLLVSGNLPKGTESYSSNLTIAIYSNGTAVKEKTETVKLRDQE